ncbi:hypothetical protein EV702DRAFT_1050871 [Suillus placidus]|uniref:Uncharacterized protein n=1 Tax=Suillus placidus TaxID=48579 RepID=A0A9P6ZI34_9AGAM|nr:hypothetical protein EV702DRAFT_1050871 [Suillus placidus]
MTGQLNVFVCEETIYTSLNASDAISHEPVWDTQDDHDSSPDDSTSPLTTRWAYPACSWFAFIPLNPNFDSPIFECLNHSMWSLSTELDSQGKLILHHNIREKWCELEQKLLWCQELLGAGLLFHGALFFHKLPLNMEELCIQHKAASLQPIQRSCHMKNSAFNAKLHHYNPSKEAVACAIEAQRAPVGNGTQSRSALGWDDNATQSTLGRGTTPEAPSVDSRFPAPQRLSSQKSGEDWKTFFVQHLKENWKKEEKESLAQQQSRESREWAVKSHNISGKFSMATVFEWQPQDEFGGNPTRLYNSFQNEWDLCNQLDPTSTSDGDWEENQFNFLDLIPDPLPPPPPVPLLLSSFMQDICNYFRCHEVAASSNYTEASTTRSIGGSATFESWVKKQKFSHVCNIAGDSGKDVNSISDVQKHVITCFMGYLVTLSTSQLSEIPSIRKLTRSCYD